MRNPKLAQWKKERYETNDVGKVQILRNTGAPRILKKKVFWYWKDNVKFPRGAIYFTIEGMVDSNGEEIWIRGFKLVMSALLLHEEGYIKL